MLFMITLVTACAADTALPEPIEATAAIVDRPQPLRRITRSPRANASRPASVVPAPRAAEAAEHGEAVSRSESANYRVSTDGAVGCAEAPSLRILRSLREAGGASPRLMAQAYREGRCMTVYRVNKWIKVRTEDEITKLRLVDISNNRQEISLYFFTSQIIVDE
jgi:hypothetical protein